MPKGTLVSALILSAFVSCGRVGYDSIDQLNGSFDGGIVEEGGQSADAGKDGSVPSDGSSPVCPHGGGTPAGNRLLCFQDDFENGDISSWTALEGTWDTVAGAGNGGTVGLQTRNTNEGYYITHPSLRGFVPPFSVEMQFVVRESVADYYLLLMTSGGVNPGHYLLVYPIGADLDAQDRLGYSPTASPDEDVDVSSRPPTVNEDVWHDFRLEVTNTSSGLHLKSYLNGQPHLEGTTIPATQPLDIVIGFWALGTADNLRVTVP